MKLLNLRALIWIVFSLRLSNILPKKTLNFKEKMTGYETKTLFTDFLLKTLEIKKE
jgi:hypothetical protein